MDTSELTDDQFNELLRLANIYYLEAQRCRSRKTSLAGCIMIGAALEAVLLGVAQCFADEVRASATRPMSKGIPKPLIEWSLGELLTVAKELEWLPSQLSLKEEFNHGKAEIGDYAEVIRQIRNLIHPARYILDLPNSKVTNRHLDLSFKTLNIVMDYILDKVGGSLKAAKLEEKEGCT